MPFPKFKSKVQRLRSSRVMETTRSGRPYVKDLHDMFSTLIISLPMETHQNSSGNYPDSFTTEEAIANLGSLKLTRSHRMPDQKNPSKIITTTTITKFTMSKSTAKAACQTFMDARLFENLSDPTNRSFRDKTIYGLTSKGIYILERFITINNLKAPHLLKIFSSQTTKIRLFAIERNHETDSITLSKQNVESVFRRFAGSKPNIVNENTSSNDRNLGIELKEYQYNDKEYNVFSGMAACNWLCNFTTLISKKEAKKIITEFIRRGLIKAVENDKDNNIERKDSKNSKLKYSKFNHYVILGKGRQIALWKHDIFRTSTLSTLSTLSEVENVNNLKNDKMKNQETFNKSENQVGNNNNNKEYPSNFKKLQQILDDKILCSLFMDFSKSILCEENLSFLLEVQNFKTKYSSNINENENPIKQEDLIVDAFRIYNDYLASNSRHELNIDFNLSQPMTQYMTSIADNVNRKDPITSHLFDKIQDVIYRLTAIDSVPKFIRTKEYLTYVRNNVRSDSISES
ncbi:regulator of G protein signaling [Rhizophagus clarus]|uniref:Regulator of G protein signaling n=1 Tax=Rhizophagus clarus TaxID=94130 RepID=A0A8H3QE94_9GLOM|nr:regulator of G protein signaling [Rhizophagus clarus]